MNFDTSLFSKRRRITQNLMFTLFRIFSYSIVAILFFILGFIIIKGIGVISWDFITQAPSDGMTKGGIWPAIVGTFYLMIGSALFAFPIGIMSGIYMNEYARSKNRKFYPYDDQQSGRYPVYCIRFVRYGILCQSGSIRRQHIGRFIDAGLLALPIIIRTTEETFKDIPSYFREGSMALGATKAQTIWKVLLPMATPRDHYGTHTLAGTCLGRDSTYPVHLRSILFTKIADQYFRPVYGIALSSLCRCNQRNRCRSTTTDRLRNSICPHRHRLDNEFSGQWYTELFR